MGCIGPPEPASPNPLPKPLPQKVYEMTTMDLTKAELDIAPRTLTYLAQIKTSLEVCEALLMSTLEELEHSHPEVLDITGPEKDICLGDVVKVACGALTVAEDAVHANISATLKVLRSALADTIPEEGIEVDIEGVGRVELEGTEDCDEDEPYRPTPHIDHIMYG